MQLVTKDITYRCFDATVSKKVHRSIEIFGFDTEADDTGRPFLYATSEGGYFTLSDLPYILFRREFTDKKYVCYNLSYDEGALIYWLPRKNLNELWKTGYTNVDGYKVRIIPKKMLAIRHGHHSVTFYDLLNFFGGSLNYNAKKYLGKEKLDIETKCFTKKYINEHYEEIVKYCIQDAVLVRDLGRVIISRFEEMGLFPQKLYSTAYVSYQYFKQTCNYITVKRFWKEDRRLLDYAMLSYNGGKFEVTRKGCDNYYEYDIVSAYPYEIANLKDITYARIYWQKQAIEEADYAFLDVSMDIPPDIASPVAVKKAGVNTYPIGKFRKVITLNEYKYFLAHNVEMKIHNAVWMICHAEVFPYREQIQKLVELKQKYKHEQNDLSAHTAKILLNSLYGKFCQIIHSNGKHTASTCWNPIYATVITANTRVKITQYQQLYPEVVAVHTDSLISTIPLPFKETDTLGEFSPKKNGYGVMLGTGIYQIGENTKFRGFESKTPLLDMLDVDCEVIKIESLRKYGWRQVVFHNWDTAYINRFEPDCKELHCRFDTKRLWLEDYQSFKEVRQRCVESLPLDFSL